MAVAKLNFQLKNSAEYSKISVEETFKYLQSNDNGLSDDEAEKRKAVFGENKLPEEKEYWWKRLFNQFWGPMPWLMEAAIILTIVIGHNLEAFLVFILLIINALISYIHGTNSQKAVELLKRKLVLTAMVLRDGEKKEVKSSNLVPGDIVFVGLGDLVAADLKIISGNLTVDQSALTGESLEIEKKEGELVYSGSSIKKGEARCIVLNTGTHTYFGKTVELVKVAKPKSHQQEIVFTLVKYMFYFSIIIIFITSIYAAEIQKPLISILTLIVIFLLGAVPFALPTVLTILQSVGAMELIKNGILVTRLNSIEDASSVDVLFLDKTGTITENKLSVAKVIPFGSYSSQDVIFLASLTIAPGSKDSVDEAILMEAEKEKISFSQYQQVSIIPFDQKTKQSGAIIKSSTGEEFKVIKSAPQLALSLVNSMSLREINNYNKTIEDLSKSGYRSLAIFRSENNSLNIAGLIALNDPPRKDAKEMFSKIQSLGIKPIIITGDNIFITQEIAKILGLKSRIILMSDLNNLNQKDQITKLENSDGVAEVLPEDKYKLVKLMQSNGHMVGMTGDGVNDAPALKQAEMGIAVANSTDVAKAAASMVLTEEGISVVVNAIFISRKIYQRILTWILNKLSKTVRLLGTLAVAFFITGNIVISVLGTAFLVFANDFVSISLATDNVSPTSYPDKWDIWKISIVSFLIGLPYIFEHLATLFFAEKYFQINSLIQIQTLILLTLIFTSELKINIIRERKHFWNSFPGKALFISTLLTIIIFSLMGAYGIFMARIPIESILFSFALAATFTFFMDFFKYWLFETFQI